MATSQRKNSRPRSTAAKSNSKSASSQRRSASATGTRSRSRSSSQRKTQSKPRTQSQPQSQNGAVETVKSAPAKAWNGAGTVGRTALGVVAGGAALGLAGRAAVKRAQRPHVLGIALPRSMRKLDVGKQLSVKKVAKQIGNVAEQLEQTGDDVRRVSAQAKKASKALS
jgi:hypothetical protein